MTMGEITGKAERVELSPVLEKELAISIYPDSINISHGTKVFMARQGGEKFLFAISEKKDDPTSSEFEGEIIMIPGSKKSQEMSADSSQLAGASENLSLYQTNNHRLAELLWIWRQAGSGKCRAPAGAEGI